MAAQYVLSARSGTQSLTTAAAALNSGTSQFVRDLIIQADPGNSVNILVGQAGGATYVMQPGDTLSVTLPDYAIVNATVDVSSVYAKSASSTATINWFGWTV